MMVKAQGEPHPTIDSTLQPEENYVLNCHPFLGYGTYVPSNLDQCIVVLQHKSIGELEEFAKLTEKEAEEIGFDEYEHRIRHSWDLEIGSVLARFFHDHEVYDPYTMESIILVALHRYLNQKEYIEEELIEAFRDKYKKQEKSYLKGDKERRSFEKKLRKHTNRLKRKESKVIKKRESGEDELKDMDKRLKSLEKQKKRGKIKDPKDQEKAKDSNWKKFE